MERDARPGRKEQERPDGPNGQAMAGRGRGVGQMEPFWGWRAEASKVHTTTVNALLPLH